MSLSNYILVLDILVLDILVLDILVPDVLIPDILVPDILVLFPALLEYLEHLQWTSAAAY